MQTQNETTTTQRLSGFIRMTSPKGYGFIRTDDGSEYFVHISDVDGIARRNWERSRGKVVEFSPVSNTGKNPRAVRVKVRS